MTPGPVRSVVAPASSANLGAGFDVFGMALNLFAEVGIGAAPDGATPLDDRHPGREPFERLGGVGPVWIRTNIPMARGLGFSGAARVAAAGLGAVVAADGDPDALVEGRSAIIEVAAELEGHGDNVAASVMGGVVAFVDGRALRFPLGATMADAVVVAWVPDVTTRTDSSRKSLGSTVERADAVVNIGRATQFALAFAHDDPQLLSGATDDRLHQPARVPSIPGAHDAIGAGVSAGAWCAWLSGSGPTVVMLCPGEVAKRVSGALPLGGHTKHLAIDLVGLRPG